MNHKVSIVIPAYNAELTIEKCVRSIIRSVNNTGNPGIFKIIVINDCSTDKTKNIVSNLSGVKVINHEKNLGLSSARNSGISHSDSNYIIFIDSDIVISKNWVDSMYESIRGHKDIVGVTGNIDSEPNKKISTLDRYLFGNFRGVKNLKVDTPLSYKFFVFSNTIVRRKILDEVGLFDESLSKYGGEDTELSIRISKKTPTGLRKLKKANSYHITQKSIDQYLNDMFIYGQYNFHQIIEKHPEYKNDLGYRWAFSFKGQIFFNVFSRFLLKKIFKVLKHPLIIKFFVIDSFVRGVRNKA
tara:strand:- start:7736 stop:8632 length:897 start_codon:yes stop_codon:yes gene_type:complete